MNSDIVTASAKFTNPSGLSSLIWESMDCPVLSSGVSQTSLMIYCPDGQLENTRLGSDVECPADGHP
jgi:hypothetical protein